MCFLLCRLVPKAMRNHHQVLEANRSDDDDDVSSEGTEAADPADPGHGHGHGGPSEEYVEDDELVRLSVLRAWSEYAEIGFRAMKSCVDNRGMEPGTDRSLSLMLALEPFPAYGVEPGPFLVHWAEEVTAEVRSKSGRVVRIEEDYKVIYSMPTIEKSSQWLDNGNQVHLMHPLAGMMRKVKPKYRPILPDNIIQLHKMLTAMMNTHSLFRIVPPGTVVTGLHDFSLHECLLCSRASNAASSEQVYQCSVCLQYLHSACASKIACMVNTSSSVAAAMHAACTVAELPPAWQKDTICKICMACVEVRG